MGQVGLGLELSPYNLSTSAASFLPAARVLRIANAVTAVAASFWLLLLALLVLLLLLLLL
jgi:hypothetical protein